MLSVLCFASLFAPMCLSFLLEKEGVEREKAGREFRFCPIKRWVLRIGRNEEFVLQGAAEDVPFDLQQ